MASKEAVSSVLEHWKRHLHDGVSITPLDGKGTVFRIVDGAGRAYVLKEVTHPNRVGGMEAQWRILHYLRQRGVPVAVPIAAGDGDHFVSYQGRVFTLSPYLPGGTHIPPEDLERAHRNLGTAIARLHRALASYPDEVQSWTMDLGRRVFEEAVPIIRPHLDDAGKESFDASLNAAEAGMRLAFADLPTRHIHGDCHGSNVLLFDGEVSGFLDLDHLPLAPRVYDLAYMLADMVKRKIHSAKDIRRWRTLSDAVLSGYQQVIPLSTQERAAISPVMLAVQLLFTEFFFENGNEAEARLNLDAFHWLRENALLQT